MSHGDPLAGRAHNGEPERLFREQVLLASDGCRLWPYGAGGHGYGEICLNGRMTTVHAATCEAWRGPRPAGHQAAHSCGVSLCWAGEHLRWDTPGGNAADRGRHGTLGRKLTEDEVLEIRRLHANGRSARTLAAQFKVHESSVYRIVARRSWRAI